MASSIDASTSGAGGVITTADNTGILQLKTAGTTAVTVDASQNVGIGTTSPATKLNISGASAPVIRATDTRNNVQLDMQSANTVAYFGTSSNHNLAFQTNGNQVVTIDTSGNVMINTTSENRTKLNVVGASGVSAGLFRVFANGDNAVAFSNSSGSIVGAINVGASTTAYNTSSDYRLKDNIQPMTGALDKVAQLKPVTYTWKSDNTEADGFIAHELAEVCPLAVHGEKDAVDEEGNPIYQGVDTSFLVATLTKAIQEQQEIIKSLITRIETLEAK